MIKRISCFSLSFILILVSVVVFVFPASATGTVTISANWPMINIDITEDPDEQFEAVRAEWMFAGSGWSTFWVDSGTDECVVPDYLLRYGYHFRVVAESPLSIVYSNVLTYSYYPVLPDVRVDSQATGLNLFWDTIDVSKFQRIDLVLSWSYNNQIDTMPGFNVAYNGSWTSSLFENVSYHVTGFRPLFGINGGSVSAKLVGTDFDNNSFSGSVTTFSLPSALSQFAFEVDQQNYLVRVVTYNFLLSEVLDVGLDVRDPTTDYLYVFYRGLDNTSDPDPRYDLKPLFRNRNLLTSSGLLTNSVYCQFVISWMGQGVVYSDKLFVYGLDGIGSVGTVNYDPSLYKPTNSELSNTVNLLYSGVNHSRIYKYMFSGFAIFFSFAGLVFLINKVH